MSDALDQPGPGMLGFLSPRGLPPHAQSSYLELTPRGWLGKVPSTRRESGGPGWEQISSRSPRPSPPGSLGSVGAPSVQGRGTQPCLWRTPGKPPWMSERRAGQGRGAVRAQGSGPAWTAAGLEVQAGGRPWPGSGSFNGRTKPHLLVKAEAHSGCLPAPFVRPSRPSPRARWPRKC